MPELIRQAIRSILLAWVFPLYIAVSEKHEWLVQRTQYIAVQVAVFRLNNKQEARRPKLHLQMKLSESHSSYEAYEMRGRNPWLTLLPK